MLGGAPEEISGEEGPLGARSNAQRAEVFDEGRPAPWPGSTVRGTRGPAPRALRRLRPPERLEELRPRHRELVLGLDALAERGRERDLRVSELDRVSEAAGAYPG